MNKMLKDKKLLLNWICIAVMLLTILLQFAPYWTYNTDKVASITDLILRPDSNRPLRTALGLGKMPLQNAAVWVPAASLALMVASIVVCMMQGSKPLVNVFHIITGLVIAGGYAATAILRQGSLWWLNMLMGVVMVALAVIGLCLPRNQER